MTVCGLYVFLHKKIEIPEKCPLYSIAWNCDYGDIALGERRVF
jgi:hypothetical protein